MFNIKQDKMVTAVTTHSEENDTKNSNDLDAIPPESPNISSLYESVDKLENANPELQNLFRALVQKTEKMQDHINTLNGKFQQYEIEVQESQNRKSGETPSGNSMNGRTFEQGMLSCMTSSQGSSEELMMEKENMDETNILSSREILANHMNDNIMTNIPRSSQEINHHLPGYPWSNGFSNIPDHGMMDTSMDNRRTRQSWTERYNQLIHYKRVNGHCDVRKSVLRFFYFD